MPNSLGNRLQH